MAAAVTVSRRAAHPVDRDPDPTVASEQSQRRKSPLWVCLRFPDLVLESRPEHDPHRRQAVIAMQQGVATVLAVSAAALTAGVRPGMPVPAATALAADLLLLFRDPAGEQRRLQDLAVRCARYTPTVSVEHPGTLLLELRASVRLFGGSRALIARLIRELAARHRLQWAAAATPLAAAVLARAQHGGKSAAITITGQAQLRGALGPLAVALFVEEPGTLKKLQRLGVRCLRDLWRLPRYDLARRFGPSLLQRLDQLLGDAPDPRDSQRPVECFHGDVSLEFPSDDAAILMTHVRALLQQLLAHLRRHDLDAGRIHLVLVPQRGCRQTIAIGTRHPARDIQHWLRLFREALQRQHLPAPVQQLSVLSNDLHPFTGRTVNWLQPRAQGHSWPQVLDLLEARLQRATEYFRLRPDHRPEQAWRRAPAAVKETVYPPANTRPLWLLPQPRLLPAQPSLVRGPERIESGWWDGGDCCRDYYVATENTGRRLWVFQDLKDRAWYLHGLFG